MSERAALVTVSTISLLGAVGMRNLWCGAAHHYDLVAYAYPLSTITQFHLSVNTDHSFGGALLMPSQPHSKLPASSTQLPEQ